VLNSYDPESDPVQYFFELDTAGTFDSAGKRSSGWLAEGVDVTSWAVAELSDNTWYWWRVKASDGFADSGWAWGASS